MKEGTIARVMDKGYGFIEVEGEEKNYFFHASELQNVEFSDLKDGDKVTFEVTDGPKGPQAANVNRTE